MKIYDESLYCQECGCEISTAQSKFCNDYCDDCYKLTERQAEQEMQAPDAKLDPDGLDKQGQAAWEEYESEEEFGTPNATYCQSMEPDHNGGWFCHHPTCVTIHEED